MKFLESDQTVDTAANVTLTCELTGNTWSLGVNISRSNSASSTTRVCAINGQGSGVCDADNIKSVGEIDGSTMTVVMNIENASCVDSGQYICSSVSNTTAKTATKLTVICK